VNCLLWNRQHVSSGVLFFISVNLYTYGSAEILITKMQKMVKLHRVRVHFEQGVTTPSSWLRNTNCTNKRRRHQPCRRVAKSVILPLYTVSHKKIPTFSAATQVAYALSDFNNFWQECFKEADRWKIILFPTSSDWLVFLHYLAKLETRKLHLFTDEMKLLHVAWLFLWDTVCMHLVAMP